MITRIVRGLRKLDPRRQQARVRELLAARASQGPYRFLVKSWAEIGELELAQRVVATEYFTTQLDPVALPIADTGPVLVMAPHQDDEVIGAGGLLLLARRAGRDVHIVYATNGNQRKPGWTPEALGKARDEEAARVCEELGATPHHLNIDNISPEPGAEHVVALRSLLSTIAPRVILVPWLLDRPPKHRLVTHLACHALQGLPSLDRCEVWQYQVHSELLPNGFVDITEVVEDKRRLLGKYRSQLELVQAYDHVTLGRDAWNSRYLPTSPHPRSAELYFTLPAEEFVRHVRAMYERDLTATYRGHARLAAAFAKLT